MEHQNYTSNAIVKLCAHQGCYKPSRTKNLCYTHYTRFRKHGSSSACREKNYLSQCVTCKITFNSIGKNQMYCSKLCLTRHHRGTTAKEIAEREERRKRNNGDTAIYLPNPTMRFCTTEMKLKPIFEWWQNTINEPAEFRIGFRANEQQRAKNMIEKLNKNGLSEFKTIIGQSANGRNKWKNIEWQKPNFPLIKDAVFKDKIIEFWKDKNVTFAKHNNCIGCFHREVHFLKYMSNKHPNKFQWFIDKEIQSRKTYNDRSWNLKVSYEKIKDYNFQQDMFDDDFNIICCN